MGALGVDWPCGDVPDGAAALLEDQAVRRGRDPNPMGQLLVAVNQASDESRRPPSLLAAVLKTARKQ